MLESADIICFKKGNVFYERSSGKTKLWGTDNVQNQLSKYSSAPNRCYCAYYPSNIFPIRAVLKIGEYLTIILRNPAEYRLILSRRRRYFARLSRIIVLLFNKLITKLTILSGQEKNSFIYSLACCSVQNYVYRRISVTYGRQILRESWPYLDSVTICWIIIWDILQFELMNIQSRDA